MDSTPQTPTSRSRQDVLTRLARQYTPNLAEAFAAGGVPDAAVLAATGAALYGSCDGLAAKFRKFKPPKDVPVSFRKVELSGTLTGRTAETMATLENEFADAFDAFVDATGFEDAYWSVFVHRHSMRTADDFETFRDSIKIEVVIPSVPDVRLNHTYMP